jgi:hypothetical protein
VFDNLEENLKNPFRVLNALYGAFVPIVMALSLKASF